MRIRFNVLKPLTFLVFFLTCVVAGLIAQHVGEYYAYVREYNDAHQRLIGFREHKEVVAIFNPLREELVTNRRASVRQFPSDRKLEAIQDEIFNEQPDATKGPGIPYLSFRVGQVNYGCVFFPVKHKPPVAPRPAPPEELEQRKRIEAENEEIDRFVSAKVFDDLVDSCKKAGCADYETYNRVMWEKLFTEHKNKNFGIGKIYLASKDNLAVFPREVINPFDFEGRDWWQAAYGKGNKRDVYNFSSAENEFIRESGVTKVYPDIVSVHNITDLTRTVWFKFNVYDRDYIFGVDIRLSPVAFSLWDRIWYLLGLLALLLLALPALIFFTGRQKYVVSAPPPMVYKLQRLERQKASYRANQKSEFKLAVTQSVRKTEENISRIRTSNVITVDSKLLESRVEKVDEQAEGLTQTELLEIKVEKTIDMTLKSGNLKTFELWKVFHPTNERYVLGLIEVLWQNNRSDNEITFEKYFWDSNTSANFDSITKELKKHLHTTEDDAFLVDQGSQPGAKPDIVGILKEKLAYVRDFANKAESYNNRVLLFDDNVPILKQLYSGATRIFATCSIEFLDHLKHENRLEDILGIPLEVRYVIDGDKRKFKDFYKELDAQQRQFFAKDDLKDRLKIIEHRASQEVIYQNRDFCIVYFGNDKCVLYTDMNNAKRGWISWREVDVGYYEAIGDFIKSGSVGKSDLDNYLKSYSVES